MQRVTYKVGIGKEDNFQVFLLSLAEALFAEKGQIILGTMEMLQQRIVHGVKWTLYKHYPVCPLYPAGSGLYAPRQT